MSRTAADVSIRPYTGADEGEVLRLLDDSLGGGPMGRRPPEFFRWKHLDNPFGPSLMLVAESEGRIVGLRAFMRWRFVAGGRELRAVRAVDTATHPDHQGRGIFKKLTLEALESLRGEADLVFNTPNEKSLPGYLKMGWRTVGRIPIRIRIRRPVRFVSAMRSIREANTGSTDGTPNVGLDPWGVLADASLGDVLGSGEPRLRTDRSLRYLRWRYVDAPLLGYRAVRDADDGVVRGLALFRLRRRGRLREATVGDVLVRDDDTKTAARLLRRVARVAPVDHVTCSFPNCALSRVEAVRSGFLRAPQGPTLVVRAIADRIDPDPFRLGSWALSLGDVEVF